MKFDRSKLNLQQKENLEAAVKAYRDKNSVSSSNPVALFVELTQNCIAKCAFCHGPNWKNQPSFNMSPDLFEIVLDDYVPCAAFVDMRGRGESLMLPDFSDYLRRIAQYGSKIRLITTLGCGTKETLQSLVDHDVFVAVSFDAADKKLYENTRCGIRYDTVIENLKFLTSRMLAKYGTLEDRIRIDICPLQKKNLPYVEGILKLAQRLEIKDILIGPLFDSSSCPDHLNNNKYMTVKAFKYCVDYAKKSGLRFCLTKPPFGAFRLDEKIFDRCCHPWFHAQISYKGDLIFCDHLLGSGYGDCVLGNIREQKEVIWNGQKAQQLRAAHIYKSQNQLLPPCADCYREGRYAEFEQVFYDSFQKCLMTEKEIADFVHKFFLRRYLFLISDSFFEFKRWLKALMRVKYSKLYAFGKKIKKWMQ